MLLVLGLALLACGPASEIGRYMVVARLTGEEKPALRPPHAVAQVKLGGATRYGISVSANSSFEVVVEPPSERLLFSMALRGRGEDASRVRFAIQEKDQDGWRPIFAEWLDPGQVIWRDRAVDLGGVAAVSRALRFETTAEPPGGSAALQPLWGSLSFAAREGEVARAQSERLIQRPNVILISLDTLGATYLSSFGHVPGTSPHIDRFLAESFSFRRAYAQYPNTLVSHASLFSGLYPIHHKVYPAHRRPLRSLVETLQRHGYLTVAFTENAFVGANFGFATGFDWYAEGLGSLAESLAGDADNTFANASAWLEKFGLGSRFFLFLHTYEVHAPYTPRDEESLGLAQRITPNDQRMIPDTALLQHNRRTKLLSKQDFARLRALHTGEIHYLDGLVGRFMEQLAALGLSKNTLVVLTADHGDVFGEGGRVGHGESVHNRVLHVPLGFYWQGQIQSGASNAVVQLVDVMPTVLELAELPIPPNLDGRALTALTRAPATAPAARPAFAELIGAGGECFSLTGSSSCRLGRFVVQTQRFKLVSSELPRYQILYDLVQDPLETHDISEQRPAEFAKHREWLTAYLQSAQDLPEAIGTDVPAIDETTRERLKALGYLD